MGSSKNGLPVLEFRDAKALEKWLASQPSSSSGAWLKLAKLGSGATTIPRQEAIDCALCHGWIDGQLGKFDDKYFVIRFTPRRPKSQWSARNKARALELITEGRMTARGLAEIDRAKSNGQWAAAYPSQAVSTVPDEFRRMLNKNKKASAFFDTLDKANRYAILYRLHHAKNAEDRKAKMAKFLGMLARGEKLHEKPRK